MISLSLAAAAGVHAVLCSLARSASSISLSLAVDTAPARSIRSSRLRVVSQVHGVKPGRREREPQHAFKGQSCRDANCHLESQAGDVGIRRSDDLHRPEPGWLVFRQQHDRPSLVELGPPDLASSHVCSWVWDGRGMLPRPRLDVMRACLPPGPLILGAGTGDGAAAGPSVDPGWGHSMS